MLRDYFIKRNRNVFNIIIMQSDISKLEKIFLLLFFLYLVFQTIRIFI